MRAGLKIREDALKIQRADILDSLESISTETTKISFALAFESILIVESLGFVEDKPHWYKIVFAVVVGLALLSAIMSIFAKKLNIHTNVDELFVKKINYDNWDEYTDNKHLRLNDVYMEAQTLLRDKLVLTKVTFGSLAAAVAILIIGVFI